MIGFGNMKVLILLPLVACLAHADSSEKQDVKTKLQSTTLNTIQPNQKAEMFYQNFKYQPVPVRPQYVQLVPKQYYYPQQQPQAMIIIAHPALVPSSLVYGNPMQQLLNYYHSNPQARYQLLHGQQVQSTYMQPVVAAPPTGNYIIASPLQYHPQVPQQYSTQQPAQLQNIQYSNQQQPSVQLQNIQYSNQQPQNIQQAQLQNVQYSNQQPQSAQIQNTQQAQQNVQYSNQQQQQPAQLSNLAQLAQLAAQQYLQSPQKSAPAIVTGFENFTPAQQAQIKAQLSTHLGSDFHAVSANPQNQYSSKYTAEQESNEFVPSTPDKTEESTMKSVTDVLKTHYTKG